MILYLSGAISASDPEKEAENIAYFMEKEEFWKRKFPNIHNPARFFRNGWTWHDYLAQDLLWIHRHRPCLMMLPGYEKSEGALLEKAYAHQMGLIVFYDRSEVSHDTQKDSST